MSAGYADYLVAMAKLFDRELEREMNGVEVPLFKEEYEEWLQEQVAESTKENYLTALLKLDDMICIPEKDFYTRFRDEFEKCNYGECDNLIACYDNEISNEIEYAEKGESGIKPKTISDYRSSFRKYAEFLRLCMQNACEDAKKQHERIEKSRESANTLFMANRFRTWLTESEKIASSTAGSYVTYIKSTNKNLFCKTGYDLLSLVPAYLKNKNFSKLDEMFTAMDGKLTERIEEYNENEMPVGSLQNARTALRAYAKFIKTLNTAQ